MGNFEVSTEGTDGTDTYMFSNPIYDSKKYRRRGEREGGDGRETAHIATSVPCVPSVFWTPKPSAESSADANRETINQPQTSTPTGRHENRNHDALTV
jgi:hypothetical protein